MRTLHVGLCESDRERSIAFCGALGYGRVSSVPGTGFGDLTMVKLPDDEFGTIELVSDPPADRAGTDPGPNHLVRIELSRGRDVQ